MALENSEKVLFVDDEENILLSLKRLFMDVDTIEVLTASSGKAGLETLKQNEIAVIVSDQRMPEMSGAEFLEKSLLVSPDSVRIVLTGYADITAAVNAINKGGAYRYIAKPWNDDDLVITILNAVERYRLVKENKRLTELTKKQNEELKKWSAELEIYVQQQTIDLTKQNKELKKLAEKRDNNLKECISSFSNLIELRDRTVRSHSNGVAFMSAAIARRMGLVSSDIENITIAAQLHDIGKIGITDTVLMKTTSEMAPDELSEYQKHAVRGQAAIDYIEDLREAGLLIRHHHEWYDGKGFPDGLKSAAIPLGARIIALADQFDRLMHGYRTHPVQEVLARIKTVLGTQFDPKLFPYLDAIAQKNFSPIQEPIELALSPVTEMELSPKSLVPGMIVSRDLKSGTGLLLLGAGTVLKEKDIEALKRSYSIDPPKTGIVVRKTPR